MSMFDSIINEAEEKFNLKGKAGTLLSALLALITDGTNGGFAGFIDRFNRAGLGDTVSSWINSDANTHLSNEQLESALGSDTLNQIAAQAGTDYNTATAATAFMTPRVVDALTPDGVVPESDDLLSRVGGYLTGGAAAATTAETFDRIGTAATDTLDADKRIVGDRFDAADGGMRDVGIRTNDTLNRVDDNFDDNNDSPLKWLIPLLLLGLLLVIGYMFCGKSPEPAKSTVANVAVNKANSNVNANANSQ